MRAAPLLLLVLTLLPVPVAADGPVTVEQRLDAARACVDSFIAEGDWVRDTPPAVDWLSRERWCRSPEPVSAGLPCDGAASELLVLRVEHDPKDRTTVQRVALTLALAPPETDWDVHYYGTASRTEPGSPLGEASYSLGTVSVVGDDGVGTSLTRSTFELGDRAVVSPGEYLQPDDLRARFRSPAALRQAVGEQLDTLEQSVTGLLDRGQLGVCPEPDAADRYRCGEMADGEGHAMYDTCVHRSLTGAETAEARARLAAEVAARRELMEREGESIQAAVSRALANDACWLLTGG